MRSTCLLPAFAAVAQAVLQIDITKVRPGQPGHLSRRATYAGTLINNITGGGYYADVTVGTPPQPFQMVLDTGSSDVWVVAQDADLCNSARLQAHYGDSCSDTYDRGASSTFKLIDSKGFSIQYLDGSGSAGDYISDDLTIGGATIQSLQLGEATQTVRGIGIMGVGFSNHEATRIQYPNIMDQFESQGLISVKAFSLYLNDRRSDSGSILFGGIDTDKFVGPLSVVPIINDVQTGTISTFSISMNGLSAEFPDGTKFDANLPDGEISALLDSGTTLSYIPEAVAVDLFDKVGAVTDVGQTGLTFIDCNFLSQDAGLVISFSFTGGPTIAVPVTEMVLDLGSDIQGSSVGLPFDSVCLFGLQSTGSFGSQSSLSESSLALLGDTFLRSAYVVYDLTHEQIGLAPANLNSSTSNIVEWKSTDAGIPTLTGAASQVPNDGSSPTQSGGGTVTVTSTNAPNGNAAGPRIGSPSWDVFAVMAAAGVFALTGGALFVL